MRKPFYAIVSNKASVAGEILIYGIIGPDYWGDGVEAKRFVRDFQLLEQKYDRINIRINSPGGSVWDGLPIFNAIRASRKDVHTYNDGIAFSMGAMILLAGKTIHVAKGSIAMLHNTSGMCWGNADEMRDTATQLDKHDEILSDLIAQRSGKTVDDVKATWMNYKDHFMTPKELLENKLADVIEDYEAKDMPTDAENMSLHQIAAFYNERMEEPSDSFIEKVSNHIKNLIPQNNMKNLAKIIALATAGITPETLAAANAELGEQVSEKLIIVEDSFVTDAANVTTQLNEATANVTKLTGELATAKEATTKAEGELATANATIKTLQEKVEAFGNNAGASHEQATGEDTPPAASADEDFEAILANMPHNKKADSI